MNINNLSVSELISLKKKVEVLIQDKCDHSSGRRHYKDAPDGDYVHCADCGKYLFLKRDPML